MKYRTERKISLFRGSRGQESRQILRVSKFHKFETACGEITIHPNTRFDEVMEDGKPVYNLAQEKVMIHLRDGVQPDERGVIRGRMEVNWRVAEKCEPVLMSEFEQLPDKQKLLKQFPDIRERLSGTGKLTNEEFLALPDEVLKVMTNNEFLSINIFPPTQGKVTHVIKLDRVDIETERHGRRVSHKEADAMFQTAESEMFAKHRKRSLGVDLKAFGPDRNNSYVFIYLK